jgi:glutamate synthase (NADPH/NADH) large chain
MAMVELEPVPEEEELNERIYHHSKDLQTHGRVEVMADMTNGDARRLQWMISQHAKYTGSKRAKEILANWEKYRPMFRKVMPVEYRRALAELKAQEAENPRLAAGA